LIHKNKGAIGKCTKPRQRTGQLFILEHDGKRNYISPSRASSYYNGHSMDNLLYEIKKNFPE